MQNDEAIWQVLRHKHCSYMSKTESGNFCQNPYNLTGVCNRSSCPLANSRYATIRDHEGVFYLYMKTIERAHLPNKLWERIKLPHNYEQALEIIDQNLMHWPKFLVHKTKQRLTKMTQMRIRMRKLALKTREKVMTLPRKEIKRESRREEKAEIAARVEKHIENEVIARLIAREDPEIWKPIIDKIYKHEVSEEVVERQIEYVGDFDEEYEIEDFYGHTTEGYGLDDDDIDSDDEEVVDVNRKRGRTDSKYNLKKKEKDAKKKGRVLVEVEHEDTGRRQKATLSI
ncbi:protein MAK16 [Artemisia annua]|uniref:Protein MAK16 homolog n=1 Tax=Artemisia annua TaxID=35608 RepID=A0A2U1LFZ0_ARTAN|nr:protein MAK16 [Artemisia annua]